MIRARNHHHHHHNVSSSANTTSSTSLRNNKNDEEDDDNKNENNYNNIIASFSSTTAGDPNHHHNRNRHPNDTNIRKSKLIRGRKKSNIICSVKFVVIVIIVLLGFILFWRLSLLLSMIGENNNNNISSSNFHDDHPIIIMVDANNPLSSSKTTEQPQLQQLQFPPSEDITDYHTISFRPIGKIDRNVTIISKKPSASSSSTSYCRNNAIVLLGQKKRHSTYNRNSYGLLVKSLRLISENYITRHNHYDNLDVFIFHTGDFDYHDIDYLESLILGNTTTINNNRKGILKLVNLNSTVYWSLPPWHQNDNQSQHWKSYDIFPIGYRHMCRFFAIKIWSFFEEFNLFQDCDYRHIMRIDEDSFILSPIDYDIFDYMLHNNFVYGYRMCAYEMDYNAKIGPWVNKWKSKTKSLIVRDITNDMCGFYNNFFVADIQFFTTNPNVKSYLQQIHRQGFIYRKRYGDLLIHTTAVYSFAQSNQIHRFLDFTYQHVTIDHILHPDQGCVVWGAIQSGYNDLNAELTLERYMEEYVTSKHCTANVTYMDSKDLSPTYQHDLPTNDDNEKIIRLKTIAAGRVELPGKGILSG